MLPPQLEMSAKIQGQSDNWLGADKNSSDLSGDISSTQLAHRLQTYALCHHPSAQLPLVLDVFTGFHSEAKHPSDKPWLSSLAVKHGIFPDEKAAREWLDGKQCDKEVKKAYGTARDLGVTGVPFFVFQDKYAASGAMGTEEFVQVSSYRLSLVTWCRC